MRPTVPSKTYDEQDQILQRNAVRDKPEAYDETSHTEQQKPGQPITTCPPQRKEEENTNDDGHHFGGTDIERGGYHSGTDEAASKVASR